MPHFMDDAGRSATVGRVKETEDALHEHISNLEAAVHGMAGELRRLHERLDAFLEPREKPAFAPLDPSASSVAETNRPPPTPPPVDPSKAPLKPVDSVEELLG
jgi:hypothetical protein